MYVCMYVCMYVKVKEFAAFKLAQEKELETAQTALEVGTKTVQDEYDVLRRGHERIGVVVEGAVSLLNEARGTLRDGLEELGGGEVPADESFEASPARWAAFRSNVKVSRVVNLLNGVHKLDEYFGCDVPALESSGLFPAPGRGDESTHVNMPVVSFYDLAQVKKDGVSPRPEDPLLPMLVWASHYFLFQGISFSHARGSTEYAIDKRASTEAKEVASLARRKKKVDKQHDMVIDMAAAMRGDGHRYLADVNDYVTTAPEERGDKRFQLGHLKDFVNEVFTYNADNAVGVTELCAIKKFKQIKKADLALIEHCDVVKAALELYSTTAMSLKERDAVEAQRVLAKEEKKRKREENKRKKEANAAVRKANRAAKKAKTELMQQQALAPNAVTPGAATVSASNCDASSS